MNSGAFKRIGGVNSGAFKRIGGLNSGPEGWRVEYRDIEENESWEFRGVCISYMGV